MTEETKRLLMVAFHYPPDNTSTGVLRTLKFTQYLPDSGWYCDVLSVPEHLYWSIDPGSVRGIPEDTRVYRVWAADTKRLFGIGGHYPAFLGVPDRYWPWIVPAVKKVGKLIGQNGIPAIFTTYPVPSALLIGLLAKRRYNNLPWIADFRDPWVEDSMPAWRRFVEARLEARVIACADRVICNTPRMRDWFLARYPHIDPGKFVTVPNGYDEDELSRVVPEASDRFEIIYTGIIAPGNRNPRPLFAAVRYALDQGWLDESDLVLTFLGAGPYCRSEAFTKDVEHYGVGHLLNVTEERIPYAAALNRTAGADLVLVLSEPLGDDPLSRAERKWSHLQVPVKLYEALGMGKQVLALVSDGAAKDILAETGSGAAVSPHEPAAIAKVLGRIYSEARTGGHKPAPDPAVLQRYSRRNLAAKLARVLNDLVSDFT